MKTRTTRFALFVILLGSFAGSLAAITFGYLQRQYFDEDFRSLIALVIGQHAGPLSIVVAAYFATHLKRAASSAGLRGVLAVACTTLWCALTTGRTLLFIGSTDETTDVLASWNDSIVPTTSFLVDGVLAYFFVASARETNGAAI